MRVYHERLRAPATWWLGGLVAVGILGTGLIAGFSWQLAVVVYGLLGAGWAAAMLIWGRTSIDISDAELRAGAATLPLTAVGEVAALDAAQARAVRGPQADPAAFLLIRPYLPRAVYVEVTDPAGGRPYWLVGTRRPAELAAAIESRRQAARAGGAPVG
jgi:hypothetical protein